MIRLDPRISFGRPCIIGTGIPTEAIASRAVAGDSIASLAADYRVSVDAVRMAIAFEAGAAHQRAVKNGVAVSKRRDALLAVLQSKET